MKMNEPEYLAADFKLPAAALDLFAGALCDAGTLGFEELAVERTDAVNIRAYFPADVSPGAVSDRIRPWLKALDVSPQAQGWERLDHLNWHLLWRSSFIPLRIGRRLLVVPSWSRLPSGERVRVQIRPERAFGTGHHESTQGCLEALDARVLPGHRVLDVGTGSGILAIAACKLGAREADACDTDPVAILNARHNVVLNRLRGRIRLFEGSVLRVPEGPEYDIILANLVLETLVAELGAIGRRLCRGGSLYVAGLLDDQETALRPAIRSAGLRIRHRRVHNGWLQLELANSHDVSPEMGRRTTE